jgi:DNA-binding response OmpR family regulator
MSLDGPERSEDTPMEEPSMVLLCEPDPDLASLLCFLLEYLGCTVRLAASLADTEAIAREQTPALAVVRPGTAVDSWAMSRQLPACLGAPVISLLPPDIASEPAPDLYVLPLPLDPSALRELVMRLRAGAES